MSQKDKLIERFCRRPKDFTYDELRTLLAYFGYTEDTSGNGSRVKFYNNELDDVISLHKPHPENIVKQYVLKMVKEKLKEGELI
ncbi:MAG: type II toxin-antitoxin system HicA family toxin [Ruminococcaceae bacterium]|nr:type II toxin-antitoxin system HicA family toxin [Oscillospiraceae bacterium]